MKLLKRYPFFLPLIIVFFCLHGFVQSYNFLRLSDLFNAGFTVSIVILFFFLLIYRFNKNIIFTSLICFYFEVWYLFFGAIQDSIKPPSTFAFFSKYSVLLPLSVLGFTLYVKFLNHYKLNWPKFLFFINLLFIIYIFIDTANLIFINSQNKESNFKLSFQFSKPVEKPDVYFLLFDGYPSNKELIDSFKFSNKNFTKKLENLQFKQLPISSNYDVTFYSMASIFNMEYVIEKKNIMHSQSDIGKRLAEIQNGTVFKIFDKMGYQIQNNSIFDVANIASLANDNRFLNGGGVLLTDKIFFNRIRKDLSVSFFSKFERQFPFFQNLAIYKTRNDNNNIQTKLLASLEFKSKKPIFSYTHLLMPHEPFYNDSLGNKIDFMKYAYSDKGKIIDFISYLKYTNSVIEKIVTAIKSKKPNAIILLMSDHGQRGVDDLEIKGKEKLSNICHVYFPNKQYGNQLDTITNVNVFKYLFNTQFKQDFLFNKDTAFVMNNDF